MTPRMTRTAANKAEQALGLATRKVDRIEVALAKVMSTDADLRRDLAAAKIERDYAAANPALTQGVLPVSDPEDSEL